MPGRHRFESWGTRTIPTSTSPAVIGWEGPQQFRRSRSTPPLAIVHTPLYPSIPATATPFGPQSLSTSPRLWPAADGTLAMHLGSGSRHRLIVESPHAV